MRVSGSSRQAAAAFRTTLSTYRDPRGATYFSNSAAVRLPSTLAAGVLGVIGLTNTVREHPMVMRARTVTRPAGRASGSPPGCEAGSPSRQTLFNFFNNGTNPGCGVAAAGDSLTSR